MANLTTIRWSDERLTCIEGDVVQDRPRVRRAFDLQWPDDVDPRTDARAAGGWLGQQLASHGVTTRQVVIVLPRSDVVLRQLSLPQVAEDELAELVALQAETQLSSPLNELVVDFLPQPLPSDDAPRQVLLATTSARRLATLQQVAEAAELSLAAVVIDPVATAELVTRSANRLGLDPVSASLIVELRPERLDVSVIRGDRLLFSHSARTHQTADDQPPESRLGEVRRAQGAFAQLFPDTHVERAWIVAGEDVDEQLAADLVQHLGCEVRPCDPWQELAEPRPPLSGVVSGLASSLGAMLLSSGGRMQSVDFLRPRQPTVRTDRSAWGKRLAVAALLAAVVAGYGWTRWQVRHIEQQVEQTLQDVERTKESAQLGRDAVRAAGIVSDWEGQRVDCLEQLDELYRLLPGTDRMYLVDYRVNARTGEHAAHIQAAGFARSRQEVEQLYQALAQRNYVVRPQEISETGEDSDYPFQFQLDVSVRKPSAG